MSRESLGRNAEEVTLQDAAELLDVTVRHLRNLVRDGYLTPCTRGTGRGEMFFRKTDVLALKEAKSGTYDLPKTTATALQAHALSQSVADRLEELCTFLGLKANLLSYDEESVTTLHLLILDRLKSDFTNVDTMELLGWAQKFNAIDEHYLDVVASCTACAAPWEPYYQLVNKIVLEAPKIALYSNPPFAKALGHILAARNNLRVVSYFYMRLRQGPDVADETFPEGDVDEEILSHILPH